MGRKPAKGILGSFTNLLSGAGKLLEKLLWIFFGGLETGLVLQDGQYFTPRKALDEDHELAAALLSDEDQESLARYRYAPSCEKAVNDSINVAYNMSYIFHSMMSYYDRDNVGLQGFSKYFKERSENEREEAHRLLRYQNLRGGRVELRAIQAVDSEYDNPKKGDALNGMELALRLEKLQNEKYLRLHRVVKIRRSSEYVANLRRVGQGHGTWHFDQMLLEGTLGVDLERFDPSAAA
eukprot:SM000025S08439  [mRNA]  locus=s25:690925:693534:- [translate_table: standard]